MTIKSVYFRSALLLESLEEIFRNLQDAAFPVQSTVEGYHTCSQQNVTLVPQRQLKGFMQNYRK